MDVFERQAQVSETDSFIVDLVNWLNGEALTGATLTPDALLTLDSNQIVGTEVQFTVTGVSVGRSLVELNATTATRTRCFDIYIDVVEC